MEQTTRRNEATPVDVVIVGAGLAGTSAAIVLGRQGFSVALIDTHAVFPPEFRAEKLGDAHLALINRLGLGELVQKACTPVDLIDVHRFGRLVAREARREYGFAYGDFVNAARGLLPASVDFVVGRVAATIVTDDRQSVAMADGRRYEGRLLVAATGLGDAFRRSVGIERVEEMRTLSLSLGFDLAEPAYTYPFETVTAYGYRRTDRLAYLTLFPIGDTLRANLFVYREAGDAWTKAFRKDPEGSLRGMFPELASACRDFALKGRVDVRPIGLVKTREHRRGGVVLIGDAFQTTCPIPGYGILRVLTDVEQLCAVHAPRWLRAPGMGVEKIATFYDDPVKTAMDAKATRASLYARAMVVEDGPIWTARRIRNTVVRRGLYEMSRMLNRNRPGAAKVAALAQTHR